MYRSENTYLNMVWTSWVLVFGSSLGILADSILSSGICITLVKLKESVIWRLFSWEWYWEACDGYLHLGWNGLQNWDDWSLEELMSIEIGWDQ